ncbi:MAG: SET domain-containing protein-lysine N-methyltransferase [Planctomycetes bacterium]|nr:SET domain-containing protein-lysine N-methyltransferase [Planctomycetota bacterium]
MVRPARMKRASRAVFVDAATCGQGVFARRRFRAGETIAEVEGTVIADPDYWSAYCIDLDEGTVLEPAAPFRFLNHSCQPNGELVDYTGFCEQAGELRHVIRLRALEAIRPGEEITIDYAWSAESAIPCMCGADACRGWVVDPEELADVGELAHQQQN